MQYSQNASEQNGSRHGVSQATLQTTQSPCTHGSLMGQANRHTLIRRNQTIKTKQLEEMKMTNLTIEMVEEMEYKELQGVAKEMKIKANQSKAVLKHLITAVLKHQNKTEEKDEFEMMLNDEFEVPENNSASEASATQQSTSTQPEQSAKQVSDKIFTYVASNNLFVTFKQLDKVVYVGWSVTDGKCYIKVNDEVKLTSVQSVIDKFKRFTNNVHGDVARIVKALVRIRKVPAQIVVANQQRKQAASEASSKQNNSVEHENVSRGQRKENASRARYSGTVDASWLAKFRADFEMKYDRKPTGLEILDAKTLREA